MINDGQMRLPLSPMRGFLVKFAYFVNVISF